MCKPELTDAEVRLKKIREAVDKHKSWLLEQFETTNSHSMGVPVNDMILLLTELARLSRRCRELEESIGDLAESVIDQQDTITAQAKVIEKIKELVQRIENMVDLDGHILRYLGWILTAIADLELAERTIETGDTDLEIMELANALNTEREQNARLRELLKECRLEITPQGFKTICEKIDDELTAEEIIAVKIHDAEVRKCQCRK